MASAPLGAQHYEFKTYGREDGLGNLSVTALLQDRTGFLWAGTQAGVYRYDGSSFQAFRAGSGSANGRVLTLHESADGKIIAATQEGIWLWRSGNFVPVRASEPLHMIGRYVLASDRERLYVAAEEGVFSASLKGSQPVLERLENAGVSGLRRCASILATPDGELWIGAEQGIYHATGGRLETYDPGRGVARDRWDCILPLPDGEVLARSVSRLLIKGRGDRDFVQEKAKLALSGYFGTLYRTRSGRVLVPTDLGLAERQDGRWRLIGSDQGLPSDSVTSVMEDREGSLWIGLWGSGIARWLGYPHWEGWTKAEGLVNSHVSAITRGADGSLWIGTDNGVNRMVPGQRIWPHWSAKSGLGGDKVRVIREHAGQIWVGSWFGGVSRIESRTGSVVRYSQADGLGEDRVSSLLIEEAGRVWVSTMKGLYRSTSVPVRRFEKVEIPGEQPGEAYFRMLMDSQGRFWVCSSSGLLVLDRGQWRRFRAADGLENDGVSNIAEVPDGSLWVSYRHLTALTRLRYENGGMLAHKQAGANSPPADSTFFLGSDKQGRLWRGGSLGVDILASGVWAHQSRDDGLLWDDCTSGFYADLSGVWVGTSRGLAHYFPTVEPFPKPVPPIVLTSVRFGSARGSSS
ncbi:MAG: hypothetical protein NTY38_33210, partial [Acidobacteria bacterium]|nr:hypothetical protein [Acidobacteriota bacterium]